MIDRRKEQNKSEQGRKLLIALLVLAIIVSAAIFYIREYRPELNTFETSKIYDLTKRYRDEGVIVFEKSPPPSAKNASDNAPENAPEDDTPFKPGSAECAYVHGLYAYDRGDYEKAKELFLKSIEKAPESNDRGLLTCVYSYLNLCDIELTGEGNLEYVKGALESALSFWPCANDSDLIWETAHSAATSPENDQVVIGLMQNILDTMPGLDIETIARYNNNIAVLDYFDGNFAKSIRRFYDVQFMLKDVEAEGGVLRQKLFANSYIAGFYFLFEDYETAIRLYEDNIAIPIEDKKLNARAKYSDMINVGATYLEINDPEGAIKKCDEIEAIIPYLEEGFIPDVKAQVLDNRARAAILMGDTKKALAYMDEAEAILSGDHDDAFYGGMSFVQITRCKLMVAQGEYEKARKSLEEMLDTGAAAYAGVEDEVYPLIIECCHKLKDVDGFLEYQTEYNDYKSEFRKTVQKEYLEFSRYYSDVEFLEQKNSLLQNRILKSHGVNVAFVIVIIVIVLSALEIRHTGMLDPLTGVYNRKILTGMLNKHSAPLKEKMVVAMMDIDHFKDYNDTYGHVKGDDVIVHVAKAIKTGLRKKDIVIRYGGEEFLLILNNMEYDTGLSVCNRVLENVRAEKIPHEASDTAPIVTISLGLCANVSGDTTLENMINQADKALYEAKEEGRNRICTIKV